MPVGGLPLGGVSDGGVFLGGSEFTGAPSSLWTFTGTSADASLPSVSRATAVSVWLPLGTLMLPHWIEYGADGSAAPMSLPSTLNCTCLTPLGSLAVAATVVTPVTIAPDAGLVMFTVGPSVSVFSTVTVTDAVAVLPDASRAVAVIWCEPSGTLAVFQVVE